eukprot:XP_011666138.1 PREDICTED: vacuolar protein sorting-associated protein 13A [Strongylocentrotus purpuratus]
MSHLPFTELVTLTPYFLVHYMTDQELSYAENVVKAGVLPFWPGSESMKLILRRSTTPDNLSSRPFLIDRPCTTVLRMERGFLASLQGIGVSLVNTAYEEVAYLSLFSSPARWEVESKANRWKALGMELTGVLENAWKHGQEVIVDDNGTIQADLRAQTIAKPVQGALKRIHNPGLWIHFRKSDHHQGLHLKIQKIQIDNQLFDAYFPNVLHVNALPKDVLKKTGPRPFVEVSILRRQMPEYGADTIKYFKVLVQEASLKVDNGFILSVLDVFSHLQEEQDEVLSLRADLNYIQSSLKETSNTISSSTANPIFFEFFHLSPLKFIVSLSLSGEPHITSDKPGSFQRDLGRVLLESIGSTLTEVTEVELKLGYFERRNALLTTAQLTSEVQAHYISQGIKQAYVFILGLDVLGNPYGLYRDVKEGISDLFYEPYLGLIQGPGEFAEGLAKGVQSLLGHTIGGVADAFGGVSGTLGKALSVLSFDEDYQKVSLKDTCRITDIVIMHPYINSLLVL